VKAGMRYNRFAAVRHGALQGAPAAGDLGTQCP
jgi:hypothetical protein